MRLRHLRLTFINAISRSSPHLGAWIYFLPGTQNCHNMGYDTMASWDRTFTFNSDIQRRYALPSPSCFFNVTNMTTEAAYGRKLFLPTALQARQ